MCHAAIDVLGLMDGTPPMLHVEPPAENDSTSPLLLCAEHRALLASKLPEPYWLTSRTSLDATTVLNCELPHW